ncbi:hypothetical protein [Actinomadura sp. BRA 177]|uniref:hypothetical protein n=1 Tax=Actinomadura sp. BRA 177 TaxID=2745202 RepID=UPI0015963BD3|nr:hypothetical protein [Actinomadura sp. BRA 177]NVI88529.1 hypothetical protein [Actinomadura sp. BRA 177]
MFHDGWNAYAHHYLPGRQSDDRPLLHSGQTEELAGAGPAGQIQGLAQGVQHPVAFAKAAINWEEWKRDPIRAFGGPYPPELSISDPLSKLSTDEFADLNQDEDTFFTRLDRLWAQGELPQQVTRK